ncbi:MAG: CDP-alcohol phosphatidyltransferase family protein [Anaerolineae bacterium]|nr:CDP-alcohol phosphatidyltransferase family protein [Anaerolineae bacterium]
MSSTQGVEVKRQVKRKPQQTQWESFTDWARERAGVIIIPVAAALGRLGLHPNTLTLIGMGLQLGVAMVLGWGHIVLGGWLLLAIAPVDALDGALARLQGRQSRFGAFLDSTLDRIADAGLIIGLIAHFLRQEAYTEVFLLLVAQVAVLMVSYTRARAEALGFPCKVGLLTRLERILLIGVFCALGWPTVLAWVLTVLSVFTVVQRVLYVYALARQADGR